jgi:hypothetical protein
MMAGEPEGLTIHERESLITLSLLVFLTLLVTPLTNRKPLGENFLSVFWRWNSHSAFCAFGCDLLFGLQSFVFSSLVPFGGCYLLIYLFILPYTTRCKGNSLL